MKQGTLYIQNQGRETMIKGLCAVVLLVLLWAATLLPQSQIAILAVLVLWAVFAKVLIDTALKKGWFYRTVSWSLTDEELTVDGTVIPRGAITRVTCTPKPGFQRKSFRCWVLTVETQDKSNQWFSQNQTADPTQSIQSLQALASELGSEWQTWINA